MEVNDILNYVGIALGSLLCCSLTYLFVSRVVAKERRKHIKMDQLADVNVVIVDKFAYEKDKGPARVLSKKELAKKREKERAQKEEYALRLLEQGGEIGGDVNDNEEQNDEGEDVAGSGGGGWLLALLGCGSKHQAIHISKKAKTVHIEGEATTREHSHVEQDSHKEHKMHKTHRGDLEEGKAESWVEPEDEQRAHGSVAVDTGSLDLLPSTALDGKGSIVSSGGMKHTSAAAQKALDTALRKKLRREDKLKAEADALSAEKARIEREAYQAMLNAESAEQKEARRKEKEERIQQEKIEREAEAERKRISHVQDGLAMAYSKRREGAMLANSFSASAIEDIPGNAGALSLFDIDPRVRTRDVVDKRLDDRFQMKQDLILSGQQDSVLQNAGPSESLIPPGWLADPVMPWPLTYESMNHRRCMVVFKEPKATGWFLGTVSGISKRQGFNISAKFERSETGSIDIDGIKSVSFREEGENAYGRGWILLMRDPNYVASNSRPGTQGQSRPATTQGSRPTTTQSSMQ